VLPDSALICDKCFLREIFGEAGVTGEALSPAMTRGDSMRQTASIKGLMCGVMWIGSGHCYFSHQLSIHGCKSGYLLAV
jgi:hypothetical protein